MEYLAEFAEEADTWLTQNLLAKCCSETLEYYPFDSRRRGRFYAGVVFTVNSKQEMAQILRQRMTRGQLRIPYDRDLLDELNTEKYTLTKAGRMTYSHPEGTHDDRFWAFALAVYAAEQSKPSSRPIARMR
jgi:hypothetical protein